MYYSISGKVILIEDGRMVVECGGIGYDIAVTGATLAKYGQIGSDVMLYTYLQVQEDAMRLYGFYSKQEKAMFEQLITISGVGPKMAITIMSAQDINTLATYIVSGDVKQLSKVKGVGKKTAERIILELRNKLSKDADALGDLLEKDSNVVIQEDDIVKDAVLALMSFGINKAQALQAVEKARSQADDLETVISLAFRSLA